MNALLVLQGYLQGIFPMAEADDIYWYDPDPRAIIPLENYHCARSLRPIINKNTFEIKFNTNFREVISQCAKPRFEEDGVWINQTFIDVYTELHELGHAHSVEAYFENKLVGGLYGVSIGSAFFGESMFHTVPNASKVAFHYLIQHLKSKEFLLLDTQFINDNVARFGAIEIKKSVFKKLHKAAINKANSFFP